MIEGVRAVGLAEQRVEAVRDSTAGRLELAASFYRGDRRRYGRAELSFLRWVIARGVLNDPCGTSPGSPWWRAVNDRLLRDKAEADLLSADTPGTPSSRGVELWCEFVTAPSAASWYRAHNASVVAGYLGHEPLTAAELPAERFMMNVALLRVLYTHALVAAPRLALGRFGPVGRLLGDPRGGTVGFFMDLQRVFPQHYPLTGLAPGDLVAAEHRLARVLDYGIIGSRVSELYSFAASSLGSPALATLVSDGTPCYAWPATENALWRDGTTALLARLSARATRIPRRRAAWHAAPAEPGDG